MCLLDETSNMMTSSTTQRQIQNLIFHKLLQKPVKKRGLNHTVNIFRLPCKHSVPLKKGTQSKQENVDQLNT